MSVYNTSGLYGTNRVGSNIYGSPSSFQYGYYNDGGNNGANGFSAFRNAAGGSAPYQNWLFGQYNRIYGDYLGESGQNPSLQFTDYLTQHQGDITGRYQQENFGPTREGQQYQQRLRWVNS